MRKISTCILGAILAISGQAQATNIQESIATCAVEKDSLKRLLCYDEVAKKVATGSMKVTAPVIAAPAAKSTTSAPKKSSEVFDAEESFGAERKYVEEEQVNELKFVIKSITKGPRGKIKATFENGQVWQQKDSDKYANFSTGDKVIIKRGVFDAFYMRKIDSNRTIRVKRIK